MTGYAKLITTEVKGNDKLKTNVNTNFPRTPTVGDTSLQLCQGTKGARCLGLAQKMSPQDLLINAFTALKSVLLIRSLIGKGLLPICKIIRFK